MNRPKYVDLIMEDLREDKSNVALIKYIEMLEVDSKIIDYLGDMSQKNATVSVPKRCVEIHPECIRSAILMAMSME